MSAVLIPFENTDRKEKTDRGDSMKLITIKKSFSLQGGQYIRKFQKEYRSYS